MLKKILTFSLVLWLCACASSPVRQIPAEVRAYKKVDLFAAGHVQAAFKVSGEMNNMGLEGVLVIKKMGEDDFDVSVLMGGAYRIMQATVTPEGIAYRYLFPDADTPLVRSRINQFLNVLLFEPGVYQRRQVKKEQVAISYKNPSASVRLFYRPEEIYPFSAQTSTLLNTADLFYEEYAPARAQGDIQLPHELIYKDGKISLSLTLISLK
ncbi:MAG: hypothetical protein IKO35_02240 [Elusimicrobiaceae bacterium]|nr:hypothetical protein [Elusimicrobiaceae bacterium]